MDISGHGLVLLLAYALLSYKNEY